MARFTCARPGLLLLWAYAVVGMSAAHAAPSIQILSVPTYGSAGELQGVATGVVDPQLYDVATYFHVEGTGWWTEPNVATRTVPLNANGVDVSWTGEPPSIGVFQRPPVSASPSWR